MGRRLEPKLEARPSVTLEGKEVVGLFAGRKVMATLNFAAPPGEQLEEILEAVARLWKETNDV